LKTLNTCLCPGVSAHADGVEGKDFNQGTKLTVATIKFVCAMKRTIILSIVINALAFTLIHSANGADGKWNVDAAGNWSGTGNWTNSQIADGATYIANFEFDIASARTVTLDSSRTIGRLRFRDAGGTAVNWTLARSSSSILTLDNGVNTPTIEGNNGTTTISAVLAGSH
jgi:hypothetical protein